MEYVTGLKCVFCSDWVVVSAGDACMIAGVWLDEILEKTKPCIVRT